MKKVFILGDSGLIGRAIIKCLKDEYDILGISRHEVSHDNCHHLNLDLETEKLLPILEATSPDVIVSCTRGSYDKQLEAHIDIIEYAADTDTRVYFFSTANVFDGEPDAVKSEDDRVHAATEYGKYKVECEKILRDGLGDNAIIIRLPMVFGENSPRVKEIIAAMNHEKAIEIYDNLFFTTIWDTQVAYMFKHVLEEGYTGIFHFTAKDVMNHLTFYNKILSKKASIEVGKIKHNADYYLALKTAREVLKDFEYTNDDVIGEIKAVIKKLK